tara:strand:+ start:793 stop:1263 length:471 start_codon:yes stop_codon:yes gene_type:complete
MVIITARAGTHQQTIPVGDDWLSTAAEAFEILSQVGGSSVRPRPTADNETLERTDGDQRDRFEIVFSTGELANVGQLLKVKRDIGEPGHWTGSGSTTQWKADAPTQPADTGASAGAGWDAFNKAIAEHKAADPNRPFDGLDRELLRRIASKLEVVL